MTLGATSQIVKTTLLDIAHQFQCHTNLDSCVLFAMPNSTLTSSSMRPKCHMLCSYQTGKDDVAHE
jgi:hypothetical protein